MAYTWQTNEVITAEKLNALETAASTPDILINITSVSNGTINDVELVHYNHDAFVNKILNGEPVFGYAYRAYNYNDMIDGYNNYNTIMPISNAYLFVPTWIASEFDWDSAISDPDYLYVGIEFQKTDFKFNMNTKQITGIAGNYLYMNFYKVYDSVEQSMTDNIDFSINSGYINFYKALS